MRGVLSALIAWAAVQLVSVLLFRRLRRRHAGNRKHFLVTQGGAQLRPTADEIGNTVVSVMMGGLVLDLRGVAVTQLPARIEMLTIMGGFELIVPSDWKVQVDVQPLMGGMQDRRTGSIDPERPVDLVISGRVVMGGLDIADEPPRGMRKRGPTANQTQAA